MKVEFKFSKKHRLLTSREYQAVFKQSKRFFSKSFLILSKPNTLSYSRLGLIIKKKNVKSSVQRNTLKRVARETFRLDRQFISSSLDTIIIIHQFVPKKILSTHLSRQWKNILTYYRNS